MGQDLITCPPDRVAPRGNPFQRRRFTSQTKPIQECHPERSEGSLSGERSFAALRMTKRDGLFLEMDWGLSLPADPAALLVNPRFVVQPSDAGFRCAHEKEMM